MRRRIRLLGAKEGKAYRARYSKAKGTPRKYKRKRKRGFKEVATATPAYSPNWRFIFGLKLKS